MHTTLNLLCLGCEFTGGAEYNTFFLNFGFRCVGWVKVMGVLPAAEVPQVTFKYGLGTAQYPSQRYEDRTNLSPIQEFKGLFLGCPAHGLFHTHSKLVERSGYYY